MQTAPYLLLIDIPVAQRTVIKTPLAKPSVIHDEHLYSEFRGVFRDLEEFLLIKIKIRCFPVVDQDRALFMKIRASDQMFSVQVMECPCHSAEPFCRVDHHHLRRCELFPRFQFPRKPFRVYSHGHPHGIKLALLSLCNKIS